MKTYLLIVAVALFSSCESSTGGSSSNVAADDVVQLPVYVLVNGTDAWFDITDFAQNGNTLFIEGTRLESNDELTEDARTYDVCAIDVLVVLPTYLMPTLLGCE